MNAVIPDSESPIDAGSFGAWLAGAREALRGNGGTQVPCGDCTGCCTSSYSVQLRPQDRRALARIPEEYLVSAVGFPAGDRTMPALPNGHCPMLSEGKCSIYRDRPQTCLDYDCRVFAAAGLMAGGDDKAVINRRVRAWRFTYPATEDRRMHDAVLAAAKFIQEQRSSFTIRVPTAAMGIAVLAIRTYDVFLALDPRWSAEQTADAVMRANYQFDLV